MKQKGFTLIELLVIVGILGVLISIITPALGTVRRQAAKAQCANNLRQHGLAWLLYLTDHDDYFPPFGSTPASGGVRTYFFGGKNFSGAPIDIYGAKLRVLNRYVNVDVSKAAEDVEKDPALEIFRCPGDKTGATRYFETFGNSYIINQRVIKYGTAASPRPRLLSTVTYPRDKVFIERCYGIAPPEPGHGRQGTGFPVMVLFVDGHAAGLYSYSGDFSSDADPIPSEDYEVWYAPNSDSTSWNW